MTARGMTEAADAGLAARRFEMLAESGRRNVCRNAARRSIRWRPKVGNTAAALIADKGWLSTASPSASRSAPCPTITMPGMSALSEWSAAASFTSASRPVPSSDTS